MNKYLLPVCDEWFPYIVSTSARNMEEAENRLMSKLVGQYDLDVPADWDDFCEIAANSQLYIGELRDIEEF